MNVPFMDLPLQYQQLKSEIDPAVERVMSRCNFILGEEVTRFEEAFAELEQPYPGCLYAAYIYEAKLFDADTQRTLGSSFLRWRGVLRGMLDDIVAERGGGEALDLEALADMFTVVLEGAFITAKAVDDASVIARQLGEYRKYVELLFAAGR